MTMTINVSMIDLVARHDTLSQEVAYLKSELIKAKSYRSQATYPGLKQGMDGPITAVEHRIEIFTTEISSIEDELERRGVPRVTKA